MIVRPDRPIRKNIRENMFSGSIVQVIPRGSIYTLFFKINNLISNIYDFEIDLPSHAYQKLKLEKNKNITVSLKKNAIHVFKL